MSEIKIIDYKPKHYRGLIRLLHQVYGSNILQELLEKYYVNDTHRIVIATDLSEETVMGCAFMEIRQDFVRDSRSAFVTYVAMDIRYRRMGIGGKMISEIQKSAKEFGCTCIELTSANYRTDAHAFYEALGFTKKKTTVFIKEI